MEIEKVFCLFEQSGTFKNVFRKYGIQARDFDILDDFGQTDVKIDLFSEIDKAFDGKASLFDSVKHSDLVIAFFPCTRFQSYCCTNFQGKNTGMRNWDELQKLDYSMKLHDELHLLYTEICKLFSISLRGGVANGS